MLKHFNRNIESRHILSLDNKVVVDQKNITKTPHTKYQTALLVLRDMTLLTQTWRQIKGYSKNHQRTHSNNKTNKKFKLLNTYRLQQFYRLFGKQRRDIFPTLIIAEYTNRLWKTLWPHEWLQGFYFMFYLGEKSRKPVKLDPLILSKGIVTGIKTIKKKKKHNTAKKKTLLVGTIGLPVFFTRYLYKLKGLPKLLINFTLTDDSRKKMAKKSKKTKKKKK